MPCRHRLPIEVVAAASADFTSTWTTEGWLYVSTVINLFSRRVAGWSMSAAMTAHWSPML